MTQSMPRVMIVVDRHRPELFEYLERTFAGMVEVKVVLDRRIAAPGVSEGGEPDLRGRPDLYDELEQRGFIAVRLR